MNSMSYPSDLRLLIDLHGHLCIGSAIGYRVCKYALKLVDKGPGLVVVTGSGGCLQHAIEILTGCCRENGTIVRTEDPGWGFYDRSSGEGYRYTLKGNLLQQGSGDKDLLIKLLLSLPDNEVFNVEAFEYSEPGAVDEPAAEEGSELKSPSMG